MKRELLDCTLRDGGYLNDWNYGRETLRSVFSGLVKAKIDYIEVGFLDERRPLDLNRSINPTIEAYEEIFSGIDKGNSIVLAMIDYGTRSLDGIKNHFPGDFIDGIRVIFKKEKKEKALPYCKALKEKGYIVFAQMVSVTTYEDRDLAQLVDLVRDAKPYAVSMVDTYGLMDNDELDKYDSFLENNLEESTSIGLHTHNNLQMAFANVSHFLAREHAHTVLADGTLFGHGKSAGNAPTELIASLLNRRYGGNYDMPIILELIEREILPLKSKLNWGYQYDFFISANRRVHPNYISYLKKKGCDGKTIDLLIQQLSGDDMLLYSENAIERILNNYESH